MVCRDNSGSKNKKSRSLQDKGQPDAGVNYGLPKDVTTTGQKQENNTAAKNKSFNHWKSME